VKPAFFFLATLLAWPASTPAQAPAPIPSHPLAERLLVVYNKRDPEAKALAEFYALVRRIHPERVLEIECSTQEEITRDEFNRTIRGPIESYLIHKKWLTRTPRKMPYRGRQIDVMQGFNNKIWAIVLIRGIPLKIKEDPSLRSDDDLQAELKTNKASVDSDLALLPFADLPLEGFIGNLFYSNRDVREFSQFHADFMTLVTRLDAPTADQVRAMIRHAVETEQAELAGRMHIDTRNIRDTSSGYHMGDEWLRQAAEIGRKAGFPVDLDTRPETVPATALWSDTALYFGWYAHDMTGPFTEKNFRFRPGAIAYHIHSFSAATLRSETKHWAGPLLARGATATMGAVYEPYLRFTPEVPIFLNSLLEGRTFAEAAYQSQIALSWMTTFIGDPLYRPFPRPPLTTLQKVMQEKKGPLDWLLIRSARTDYARGAITQTRDGMFRILNSPPTRVSYEGYADLGILLNDPLDEITSALTRAISLAENPYQKFRLHMKLAETYRRYRKPAGALSTYETILKQFPEESARYQVAALAQAYAKESGWSDSPRNLPNQSPEPAPVPSTPAAEPLPPQETPTPVPALPSTPSISEPSLNKPAL
jgi:uncharacterized protein (TIGR03790 family)